MAPGGFPVPPLTRSAGCRPDRGRRRAIADAGDVRRGTTDGKDRSEPSFRTQLKGFGVPSGHMFKKVVTEQYPDEHEPTAPRYHGRHVLNRHPDGLEKCIGCELCAWACPADAIYVEGADNTEASGSPRASATAASTRSTTCAASSAGCASRPARRAR